MANVTAAATLVYVNARERENDYGAKHSRTENEKSGRNRIAPGEPALMSSCP